MKKLLLCASFGLFALTHASAQTPLIEINFDDTSLLADWFIIDADGDGNNFGVNTDVIDGQEEYAIEGGFALSFSYDNDLGPLTPDNSLITAAFTIPEGEGAELVYHTAGFDPVYYEEHYAVYVVDAAAFDAVIAGLEDESMTIDDYLALLTNPALEETVASPNSTEKTINLDAYTGQSVRVVFRHYDITDQFIFILDDVNITTQALGVNDVAAVSFQVYPNPAKDVLNISNNQNITLSSVKITDINGRVVKTVAASAMQNSQINVSDLTTGSYFINITAENGASAVKKFIKG